MKNILTLFLLVATIFMAQAQITLNVSGTVLSENGDAVANHTVYVFSDSSNVSNDFFYEQLLTDTNGNFSLSVELSNASSQGQVFISTEICVNDWTNLDFFWFPGNMDITVAFVVCDDVPDECTANIEATPIGALAAIMSSGTAPYTYEWNTGETTETVFPNIVEGFEFCVTITDVNGCSATDCYWYSDGNGGGNDTSCWVFIYSEPTNAGEGLIADATGTPPFAYAWSTGETSEEIVVLEAGTYCVDVVDASGCVSTDCFYYQPNGGGNDTACYVFIFEEPTAAGAELIAEGSGIGNLTYSWSTGETASSIMVTEIGEYCVTISDSDNCISTACYYFQGNGGGGNDSLNYQIAGYVYLNDSIFNNGQDVSARVYLIEYQENAGILTAIDSVDVSVSPNIGTLYYDFGNRPAGVYRTKAALLEGSEFYETSLPTYYSSSLFWDEATEINIPYNSFNGFPIVMQEGENPGGPGFIGGFVSEGANFTGNGSEHSILTGEGDPVAGVTIIIFDEIGNTIGYDYTDGEGLYSFPNLAWGTYRIVVELLNFEQVERWITIDSDLETPNNIDFDVNSTEIVISTSISGIAATTKLNIYPNPTTDLVNIQVDSELNRNVRLTLTNVNGEVLITKNTDLSLDTQAIQLNVNDLSLGVYFVNLTDGKSVVTGRFVVGK